MSPVPITNVLGVAPFDILSLLNQCNNFIFNVLCIVKCTTIRQIWCKKGIDHSPQTPFHRLFQHFGWSPTNGRSSIPSRKVKLWHYANCGIVTKCECAVFKLCSHLALMAQAKSVAEASERARPLSDVPLSQLGAKDVAESSCGHSLVTIKSSTLSSTMREQCRIEKSDMISNFLIVEPR